MSKIVIAKNNYFLMKDGCFYGPYHSIAEAELNRFKPELKSLIEKPDLKEYKFLKNVD
jgi:hypothetical protein